jgi:Ca2+-dependent lipid-binding protein
LGAGQLSVTVVKCSQLIAADMGGASDPYVVVKCAHLVKKTKTVKATLNPEFNERFKFRVRDAASETLTLQVFDWDRISSDDQLGNVTIPVKEIANDPGRTAVGGRWCELFS